jgi:SAM-dependent methyltransferase
MISRSHDYVEYCRETATHLKSSHDLALRGSGKEAITASIHRSIVREVGLVPEDELVDIGCGDGTLLRMAGQIGVRSAVGFLATDEEVACVKATGLNVQQAYSDHLPLPDAKASVVVCNNVLLIVPRDKIFPSLREMHRIARPGARIFIGEIPFTPGPPPEPQFDSSWQTLAYLYRKHGARTCLGDGSPDGALEVCRQAHGDSGWLASFLLRRSGRASRLGLRCRAHARASLAPRISEHAQ